MKKAGLNMMKEKTAEIAIFTMMADCRSENSNGNTYLATWTFGAEYNEGKILLSIAAANRSEIANRMQLKNVKEVLDEKTVKNVIRKNADAKKVYEEIAKAKSFRNLFSVYISEILPNMKEEYTSMIADRIDANAKKAANTISIADLNVGKLKEGCAVELTEERNI